MPSHDHADQRRTERQRYAEWVEFGPLDIQTGRIGAHLQSAAFNLNDQGVGVLTAEPFDIGSSMFLRLRTKGTNEQFDRFGIVRTITRKGHWVLCGIEFTAPPEGLEHLTFEDALRRAA